MGEKLCERCRAPLSQHVQVEYGGEKRKRLALSCPKWWGPRNEQERRIFELARQETWAEQEG